MTVNVGDEFRPNEICGKSGIYRVQHHPAHAPDHEVTCVKGRTFSPCRICGNVRFVLVKHAPRLESHEFFRGVVTGGLDALPDRRPNDKATRFLSRHNR
jgi:hypothetical protein